MRSGHWSSPAAIRAFRTGVPVPDIVLLQRVHDILIFCGEALSCMWAYIAQYCPAFICDYVFQTRHTYRRPSRGKGGLRPESGCPRAFWGHVLHQGAAQVVGARVLCTVAWPRTVVEANHGDGQDGNCALSLRVRVDKPNTVRNPQGAELIKSKHSSVPNDAYQVLA